MAKHPAVWTVVLALLIAAIGAGVLAVAAEDPAGLSGRILGDDCTGAGCGGGNGGLLWGNGGDGGAGGSGAVGGG